MFIGKSTPIVNSENDTRPRPPVRESSLHSSAHITSNGTTGRHSLPTTKLASPPTTPTNTLTTNQLMMDYDSLLSFLTLKYGSPGERESCLRLIKMFKFMKTKSSFLFEFKMVSRYTISICM